MIALTAEPRVRDPIVLIRDVLRVAALVSMTYELSIRLFLYLTTIACHLSTAGSCLSSGFTRFVGQGSCRAAAAICDIAGQELQPTLPVHRTLLPTAQRPSMFVPKFPLD